MGLRQVGRILISASVFVVGCYSPNIHPGGFGCGEGGACPDNFKCNTVDHRCYQGDHDASVEKPVCNSVTTSTPSCTPAAATGECNPACQTGCGDCGWCAVVNGVTKCVTGTAGPKDVGAICDPTLAQSDCKYGLYCQPGCSSSGRCYRFCDSSDTAVCGAGSTCGVNPKANGSGLLSSVGKLCSLVDTCDPIAQTGCPAPFACYPTTTTNVNECDCPGTIATGAGCSFIAQCVAGDSCFGPPGSPNTCLPICIMGAPNPTCASGTSCQNPAMAMYGYCL